MNKSAVFCSCAYIATVFAGATQTVLPAPAQRPVLSPIARWYQSLPGWRCPDGFIPPAYEVSTTIGRDTDAYLKDTSFVMYPEFSDTWKVGALYDSAHRVALFHESDSNALRPYLLIANAGPPPIPVEAKSLSGLAVGGRVHLGDTLGKVRTALDLPASFHLASLKSCRFPDASEYRAAILYGPTHDAAIASSRRACRLVGPDLVIGQTLATVMFRANRVAVLVWDMCTP